MIVVSPVIQAGGASGSGLWGLILFSFIPDSFWQCTTITKSSLYRGHQGIIHLRNVFAGLGVTKLVVGAGDAIERMLVACQD